MRHRGSGLAAAVSVGVVAALVWAAATDYTGGPKTFGVTGAQSGTWVEVGEFQNKTGKPICDFVVAPAAGQSVAGVQVNGIEVVGKGNFKFDDNDNKQIDADEIDNEDASHGSTGRSISNSSNCINDNATFTLNVKVTTTQSTDFQWQATRRGAALGHGGSLVGTFAVVSSSAPRTETILNAFNVKSIEVLGKNGAAGPILSLSFVPPSGVAIEEVSSETNPGTWDAGSRRFTFSDPVASDTTFHVDVRLENLAAGDTRELSWNANY